MSDTKLLVVPVINSGGEPANLRISSSIVRYSDGAHVLFYPVVSLVNGNFEVFATIKPKYEFAFDGKTLLNEFQIPAGVNRLLVHTDPEYFKGEFTGSVYSELGAREKAYAAGAVLGGLVGVAIVRAATDRNLQEFVFGEVGVVSISKQ
jgi:hypothetical protein